VEKLEYLKVLIEAANEAAKTTSYRGYDIEKSIIRTCKSIEDDLGIEKEKLQGNGQTHE
jgi:hypothetical protein